MSYPKNERGSARINDVITSVITHEGELLEIYYHINTGRVITRETPNPLSEVPHAAIILGADKYGNFWVAHNHPFHKKPAIDMLRKFSKGERITLDSRPVLYTSLVIAGRTMNEVLKAKKYDSIVYNSETFTNIITGKIKIIKAVEKLSEGILLISILSTFLKIID